MARLICAPSGYELVRVGRVIWTVPIPAPTVQVIVNQTVNVTNVCCCQNRPLRPIRKVVVVKRYYR